ncbi:MAG: DUF2752 domain-containing protein [Lachnospiraceae bacterium]|nr:DUF2752 domain-containing protein [Lachnospiraceae bacterium]
MNRSSVFSLLKGRKIRKAAYDMLVLGIYVIFYRIIGCPIKTLTGISCAGCGMTRALFAAGTGHVRKAFHYHPLFWCIPVGFLCFIFRKKISQRFVSGMQYAAMIIFLVVYVFRMLDPQCDIVTMELTNGWIYKWLWGER